MLQGFCLQGFTLPGLSKPVLGRYLVLLITTSSCLLFKKPQIGDAPAPIFLVGFQFMRMKKPGGFSYLRNLIKGLAAFMKEALEDKLVVIKDGYLILLKHPSMVLGYTRTGSLLY
jgi:hypothetical protein